MGIVRDWVFKRTWSKACREALLPGGSGRDGHLADRSRAQNGQVGRAFLDHLEDANLSSNPELFRLALKLATGAGKTTVMAMLIAWQTDQWRSAAQVATNSPADFWSLRPASPFKIDCACCSRAIPTATTPTWNPSRCIAPGSKDALAREVSRRVVGSVE